jgi:hypothetical protein
MKAHIQTILIILTIIVLSCLLWYYLITVSMILILIVCLTGLYSHIYKSILDNKEYKK